MISSRGEIHLHGMEEKIRGMRTRKGLWGDLIHHCLSPAPLQSLVCPLRICLVSFLESLLAMASMLGIIFLSNSGGSKIQSFQDGDRDCGLSWLSLHQPQLATLLARRPCTPGA